MSIWNMPKTKTWWRNELYLGMSLYALPLRYLDTISLSPILCKSQRNRLSFQLCNEVRTNLAKHTEEVEPGGYPTFPEVKNLLNLEGNFSNILFQSKGFSI